MHGSLSSEDSPRTLCSRLCAEERLREKDPNAPLPREMLSQSVSFRSRFEIASRAAPASVSKVLSPCYLDHVVAWFHLGFSLCHTTTRER